MTANDHLALAQEACEAAGLDPSAAMNAIGTVRSWVDAGAGRELILDVVTKGRNPRVWTLGYFTQRILRAASASRRLDEPTPAKPEYDPVEEPFRQRWRDAMDAWIANFRQGPMPDLQGYIARAYAA